MKTACVIIAGSLAVLSAAAFAATVERATVPAYDGSSLAKACTAAVARAQAMVGALQAVPMASVPATDMLGRWDRLRSATQDIEGPAELLANVSPDEKTRAGGEDCEQKINSFDTALLQNEQLYARIKATSPKGAAGIKESLSLLTQFCSAACPAVDDDLLARLSAARLYGAGLRYSRQHLYAAYDMATSGPASTEPLALWDTMEGETPLGHVPGTQFPGTFGHIISGYAAGYYGTCGRKCSRSTCCPGTGST